MPYKKYPLIRPKGFRTRSIHDQPFRIGVGNFARPAPPGGTVTEFLDSLPGTGSAAELRLMARRLREFRKGDLPVVLALGDAHAGLHPLVIDLMERGWISALAVSWNTAVTDFEVALAGRAAAVSHDPANHAVTEETGLLLNAALKEARQREPGCGEVIGAYMHQADFPFSRFSLLATAYGLNIPVTVHAVGGRNAVRMHPHFNGATIAVTGERDFHLLASILCRTHDGAAWLQVGQCPQLAGVFLDVLDFCSAAAIDAPRMDAGLLCADHPCSTETDLLAACRRTGGWSAWIPGDADILFPLLTAFLLNPDSRTEPDGGEKE